MLRVTTVAGCRFPFAQNVKWLVFFFDSPEIHYQGQCYYTRKERAQYSRIRLFGRQVDNLWNAAQIEGSFYFIGISACSSMFSSNAASIRGGRTHLKDYEAPFLFARLRTTDNEDEACQDESRIRELGSIKVSHQFGWRILFICFPLWFQVKIEWVRVLGEVPFRSEALPQTLNQPVWEGTKKATNAGHSVTLGNWEETARGRWLSSEPVSGIPVCEFIFRYGPIGIWTKCDIIKPVR